MSVKLKDTRSSFTMANDNVMKGKVSDELKAKVSDELLNIFSRTQRTNKIANFHSLLF